MSSTVEIAVDRARSIRAALLPWYDANRRDLPWRRRRDAYAIWISEIMLQQTRVETVIPHYDRFLERFPTVEALAAADLDDVLARWSGLGYYRRARSLHAAAGEVVRDHDGSFPTDLDGALALPGIGRYTAGAILSIAFDLPAPILDGNVIRILSRWLRIEGPPRPAGLWRLAEQLVDEQRPGDFNQAMMELGATVCTPKRPSCEICPVADQCAARAGGSPEDYPERPEPAVPRTITTAMALAERNGRMLFCRPDATEDSPLAGLWGLPFVTVRQGESARQALQRRFRQEIAGVTWEPTADRKPIRHSITNRRYTVTPVVGRLQGKIAADGPLGRTRWILPAQLADYPVGGLMLKVLRREGKWSGR